MNKICRECLFEGNVNLFAKRRNICTKCYSEMNKNYRASRKDVIIKYREAHKEETQKYYINNKEKISSYHKKYRENNKKKLRSYNSNYKGNRRRIDPAFKLRSIFSTRIALAFRKNNVVKNNTLLNSINYSIKELKEHLESLFEIWMNWGNYGTYKKSIWNDNDLSTWTWQIDHIIPQSDLPYSSVEDENFKKCWSLENLRPYPSKLNLLDGVSKIRHERQ